MFYTYKNSPIGSLLLTSNGSGLTGLYTCNHPMYNTSNTNTEKYTPLFDTVNKQLTHYFNGTLQNFLIPLCIDNATPFQIAVWQALQSIPYGQTRTYKEIAKMIGNINASRAIGGANNKNPISIIIPCHRVIGSDNAIKGYAGGASTKKQLLKHELMYMPKST